jgi:hypothetical protein
MCRNHPVYGYSKRINKEKNDMLSTESDTIEWESKTSETESCKMHLFKMP